MARKVVKITFEFEDGLVEEINGKAATLMQARINSAGIMAGIELVEPQEEE